MDLNILRYNEYYEIRDLILYKLYPKDVSSLCIAIGYHMTSKDKSKYWSYTYMERPIKICMMPIGVPAPTAYTEIINKHNIAQVCTDFLKLCFMQSNDKGSRMLKIDAQNNSHHLVYHLTSRLVQGTKEYSVSRHSLNKKQKSISTSTTQYIFGDQSNRESEECAILITLTEFLCDLVDNKCY